MMSEVPKFKAVVLRHQFVAYGLANELFKLSFGAPLEDIIALLNYVIEPVHVRRRAFHGNAKLGSPLGDDGIVNVIGRKVAIDHFEMSV